jgi:hypothetical protein
MRGNVRRQWLRRAAGIGLALFVLIVVLEHVLAPELSPANHTISEYANAGTSALALVAFVLWSASLAATAAVIHHEAHEGPGRTARLALEVLLLAACAGLLLTAAFRTQAIAGQVPPDVARTTAGRFHDVGSGITTLALVGAVAASIEARASDGFRRGAMLAIVTAVATHGILLAVGPEVGGLRQRLLVAIACVWQAALLVTSHPEDA